MALRDDIERKLRTALAPSALEIHDDSAAHAGHQPQTGGAEGAHVRVVVVSEAFVGKSTLQRHRLVNDLFRDELASNRIHALQITARVAGE